MNQIQVAPHEINFYKLHGVIPKYHNVRYCDAAIIVLCVILCCRRKNLNFNSSLCYCSIHCKIVHHHPWWRCLHRCHTQLVRCNLVLYCLQPIHLRDEWVNWEKSNPFSILMTHLHKSTNINSMKYWQFSKSTDQWGNEIEIWSKVYYWEIQ